MQNQWSMRPASEDDLKEVLRLEKEVHLAPWTEEQFREELAKPYSHFWVVTDDETDEKIAAYIVFWQMDEIQVLNIVTAPDYRRRGFAKMLLQKMVNQAIRAGIKKALLEVRRSNINAVQLYQAQGFNICQIRRQFYSNGEDAYQMILELLETPPDF